MSAGRSEHNDLEDFEADAEDHIITINLNSAKANQPISAAKRATTTNFQDAATYRQNELSIAASMIYTDGDGAQRFRLVTRPPGPSTGRHTVKDDHWLLVALLPRSNMALNSIDTSRRMQSLWMLSRYPHHYTCREATLTRQVKESCPQLRL